MRTSKIANVVGMVAIATVAGCGLIGPGVCTLEAVYGVSISLMDAAGDPITDAELVLTDGDYQETMEELRPGVYVGAVERAGEYSVTIEVDGFEPVMLDGLNVETGRCHVVPVSRNVVLSPDAGA